MATKVICDRCGKDVETSDTQLIFKIFCIINKTLLFLKEKDYCKSCYDFIMAEIEAIIDEEIKTDF